MSKHPGHSELEREVMRDHIRKEIYGKSNNWIREIDKRICVRAGTDFEHPTLSQMIETAHAQGCEAQREVERLRAGLNILVERMLQSTSCTVHKPLRFPGCARCQMAARREEIESLLHPEAGAGRRDGL